MIPARVSRRDCALPWRQVTPMDERTMMIGALHGGDYSVTEASRALGVSRKTVYKWLTRLHAEGWTGLADRSRAPRNCPHRTPEVVAPAIEDVRKAHPSWGPRKVIEYMRRRSPYADDLPAPSAAGDILKRAGPVPRRRRRRPSPAATRPAIAAEQPNNPWCADFKGEFLTTDGVVHEIGDHP